MTKTITAELIKTLRDRTGVSMSKCKEALEQAEGDIEKAIDNLRKSGMASAVKKEGRETNEGLIAAADSNSAVAIVEINAETDFVTQNEKFKQFLQDVAKQLADTKPKDLDIFLKQPYSKDKSLTVDEARAVLMQSLGENIKIRRFSIVEKNSNSSVGIYSHMGGKIVTVVCLEGASGLENFAKEIGMHVAAEAPEYLDPSQVPADIRAREEEIARSQVAGKPANIVDKIVEGKINAFYDAICLSRQKYVKDNSITVTQLIEQEGKKRNSPIRLTQFVRWQVGS